MRRIVLQLALVSAALLAAELSEGATFRVPEQYGTIQAAIDASATGDTVRVAPGTYTGPGNRGLDPGTRNIVILGEAGAEATVIDCEEQDRALWVHGGQTTAMTFRGFTVRNGKSTRVGGIFADPANSWITISECIVEYCTDTESHYSNPGAMAIRGRGILENSVIRHNVNDGSPSVVRWWGGTVSGCHILDNGRSEALNLRGAPDVVVEDCVLSANHSGATGIYISTGTLDVQNTAIQGFSDPLWIEAVGQARFTGCTFDHGLISVWYSWEPIQFERCIFPRYPSGGIWLDGGTAVVQCCALEGPIPPGYPIIVDGDQVWEDPMLCNPAGDDFRLQPGSPCLPENSPCGELIGAYGLGCDVSGLDAAAEDPRDTAPSFITWSSEQPARDVLRYRLRCVSAGTATAEIVDPQGRRLASRTSAVDAGEPELEWRPLEDGVRLESGAYFLRVTGPGGETASSKFIWLSR